MCWHLAEPGLASGAIIAPGRWGQVVVATPGHSYAAMELYFEGQRRIHAPTAPSRLGCVFVFEDPQAATFIWPQRASDVLYPVELVVPNVNRHRANILCIHSSPDVLYWPRSAQAYWLGEDLDTDKAITEVLVGGPVRVTATAVLPPAVAPSS